MRKDKLWNAGTLLELYWLSSFVGRFGRLNSMCATKQFAKSNPIFSVNQGQERNLFLRHVMQILILWREPDKIAFRFLLSLILTQTLMEKLRTKSDWKWRGKKKKGNTMQLSFKGRKILLIYIGQYSRQKKRASFLTL